MPGVEECNMTVKQNTCSKEGAAHFPWNLNLKEKNQWGLSTPTTLTMAMHIKFLTSQTYQGQTYYVSNLYTYTV